MTDANHATPGPLPPPQRSGHGCLSGCLIAAAIALVAIIGAVSYGGWWLSSGFKNDPTLHTVMTVVNGDQIARAVLGDDIQITNLESTNISSDLGTGKTASYVAHLKGSKAQGTLTVTVRTPRGGHDRITSMTLTGPDGHKYDLLSNQPLTPAESI